MVAFVPHLDYDDVYDAIRRNDMAGGLLAARDIMRKNHCMEPILKNVKNEFTSNSYRNEGNAAYTKGDYQEALELYNKALLYAPKYSRAMKLAYSNRSALLFKAKYYSACLKDVDTCFEMGCPSEVIDKLRKRKEEALGHAFREQLSKNNRAPLVALAEKFMKPQTSNPDISGAGLDIKVVIESDGPKVVAARDIDVGTILALETAFVSSTHPRNNFCSCFYCHKMSLNLIPCDGCCYALFCNKSCQKKCLQENHNFICPIIDIFNTKEPDCILATETLVKLRQTKSWEDIIAISREINARGLSYDDNPISNLISKDNKHFVVGIFFNHSLNNAVIIHYLDTKTDFFPHSPDARVDAITAASKIIMNLSMYATSVMLASSVTMNCVQNDKCNTCLHRVPNYGLFTFIGKMKRSCLSNVITVAVHRDVALVSVVPIKKDTEITIPHMWGYWLAEDWPKYKRSTKMFFTEKTICSCVICSGDWNRQTLNKTQAKKFNEIDTRVLQRKNCKPDELFHMYRKVCGTMKALSDAPFSKEYRIVYAIFMKCTVYFQSLVAQNLQVCLYENI